MTKEQKEYRDKLFPDGPPTPEEFILRIAEVVREEMAEEQEKTKNEKVH